MRRFRLGRRMLIAISVYAALWTLTYALGGRQVAEITAAELEIKPSYRRVPVDTAHLPELPVYGYSVVSYAPFVLTARYMVWWDDEGAAGGTAVYLWLGRPSRPFRIYDWRV